MQIRARRDLKILRAVNRASELDFVLGGGGGGLRYQGQKPPSCIKIVVVWCLAAEGGNVKQLRVYLKCVVGVGLGTPGLQKTIGQQTTSRCL